MRNRLLPENLQGSSPAIFFLNLNGSRTPCSDPGTRTSLIRPKADAELSDLLPAVLDGGAFVLTDCVRALDDAGTEIQETFAVGGEARSAAWLQIIANSTGANLLLADEGEYGTALSGEFQPVMTAQKRTEHSKAPRTGCGAGAGHMPDPQRDKFMPMPAGGLRMRHKGSGKRTDTALKG